MRHILSVATQTSLALVFTLAAATSVLNQRVINEKLRILEVERSLRWLVDSQPEGGVQSQQSIDSSTTSSRTTRDLAAEKEKRLVSLRGRLMLFRGLMRLSLVLVTLMVGVFGWTYSYRTMKRQIQLFEKSRQIVEMPTVHRWIVSQFGVALVVAAAGYCVGWSLSGVLHPDLIQLRPLSAWNVARSRGFELAFSTWFPLVEITWIVVVLCFGYLLDLRAHRKSTEGRTSPDSAVLFIRGGSNFYWALALSGMILWSTALGGVYSKRFDPFVLTPSDTVQLHIYLGIYLLGQASLIAGTALAIGRLTKHNKVEKRSHQPQRVLILLVPFMVSMVVTLAVHHLALKQLHATNAYNDFLLEAGLVILGGLPVALMSPLFLISTLSARPGPRIRPFWESARFAVLFLIHVVQSNKVIFFVSLSFSLLILFRYDPNRSNTDSLVIANLLIAMSTLWLVPLVHSLLSFETTCFNAYQGGLRAAFRLLNHHFVVGGYGDFGQRVAQGIVVKASRADPLGFRSFFDCADLIMPDGRMEKLWAGLVVVDRDPERFHWLASLEDQRRCGVAYVPISEEPGVPAVPVPAIVGNISNREVGNAVALDSCNFFASLVRDRAAPMLLLQALVNMRQRVHLTLPSSPPLTVLTASNQSQYDSLIRQAHEQHLPIHVVYPSQLEGLQFAGRLYALQKKFRKATSRFPRILIVGRGKHLGLAIDSYFRLMQHEEIKAFKKEHPSSGSDGVKVPRLLVLTDHEQYREIAEPWESTKGLPPTPVQNRFAFEVLGQWKSPIQDEDPTKKRQVPDVSCLVPVVFRSPLDWETLVPTLRSYRPDVVALIDYDYLHQHATLGLLLSAIRRTAKSPKGMRDAPVSGTDGAWLPLPELIVCRENGPGGAGIRRQLNRMLIDYARLMREEVGRCFAMTNGEFLARNEYLATFPAIPTEERCLQAEREGGPSVDRAVNDIVVDVLDESVSRVVALADARLPKGDDGDPTFEMNFCLPDSIGTLARFWSMGLQGRDSTSTGPDTLFRNRLLLSSIRIEEDLDLARCGVQDDRYVGKSFAYLPSAGDAGHDVVGAGARQKKLIEMARVRITRNILKGSESEGCVEARQFIDRNLERVYRLNQDWIKASGRPLLHASTAPNPRYWKAWCPASMFCGLDTIAGRGPAGQAGGGVDLFERVMRIKAPRLDDATPFAFLEFRGKNQPGAAAEVLNLLLLRRTLPAIDSPRGFHSNATFLSDYQCNSERHSRLLMFIRFLPGAEALSIPAGSRCQDVAAGMKGIDEIEIRPIIGLDQWRAYALDLKMFLSLYGRGGWELDYHSGRIRLIRHESA